MTFGESIQTVLSKKYFKFSGRASRSEFWWFQLYASIFYLINAGIFWVYMASPDGLKGFSGTTIAFAVIVIVFGIVTASLPGIALQVRRLHDSNMSGWWYLVPVIIGLIPALKYLPQLVMFGFGMIRGTQGDNRFGPDPRQPYASAEVFA